MSTLTRNSIIVVLWATAAHAQTPLPYGNQEGARQGRIISQPATQTGAYTHQQYDRSRSPNPVQAASHSEGPQADSDLEPMPLRSNSNSQRLTRGPSARNSGTRATTTVLMSLTVVISAFFVLVWLSRKTAPKGMAPLPGEVFESLGRAPLTARQQMQLIRLGNKLVLLSVTATGAEALTEITDLDEVNRLSGLCQQRSSGSVTESFRNVLSQYAEEPAPAGFVGDTSASQADIANRSTRRERRREGGRD